MRLHVAKVFWVLGAVLLGSGCMQKSNIKYATQDQYILLEKKNRELEGMILSLNRQLEMMQSKLSLVKVPAETVTAPAVKAPTLPIVVANPVQKINEEGSLKFTNEDLKRRTEAFDKASESMYNSGILYFAKGQHSKSVSVLNDFITKYPKSPMTPTAMMKLGASYQQLGKIEMARTMFEKTIKMYPNTIEAKDAQDELGRLKGGTP